jgi:hypothetical protein
MFEESGEGKGPVNLLLLSWNFARVAESAAGKVPERRLSLKVRVVKDGTSPATKAAGSGPVNAFDSRAKV